MFPSTETQKGNSYKMKQNSACSSLASNECMKKYNLLTKNPKVLLQKHEPPMTGCMNESWQVAPIWDLSLFSHQWTYLI